jgi:ubiquinone/menaquinone biosynthesis C-methylase UbiE
LLLCTLKELKPVVPYNAEAVKKYYERYGASHRSHYNTKLIATELAKAVYVDETTKILEVGCGFGDLSSELSSVANEVTALDYSQDMIELACELYRRNRQAANIHFVTGDALYLPFRTGEFDVVVEKGLSLMVYDSLIIDGTAQAVLSEMKRVSRDKVVCIHVNRTFFRKAQPSMKLYTAYELKRLLKDAGLSNVQSKYVLHSNPWLFNLLGVTKTKAIDTILRNTPAVRRLGGFIIAWGSI